MWFISASYDALVAPLGRLLPLERERVLLEELLALELVAEPSSLAARVGRALFPARYRRKQSRREQEMARQMAEVPIAPPPGRSLRRLHGLEGSRKDFGDVLGNMADGNFSASAKRVASLGATMAGNACVGLFQEMVLV